MASGLSMEDRNLIERLFQNASEALRNTNNAIRLANEGSKKASNAEALMSDRVLDRNARLITLIGK